MPIYEVEDAEGNIFELDAPDWDTAAKAYNSHVATQPQNPQPQAEKPLGYFDVPDKESWATQGMSAVGEGLSNIAGLPMDAYQAWRGASDWAGNKVNEVIGSPDAYHNPIPQVPEGGYPFSSEQLQGGLKDMGLIQPQSNDPTKRVFRRGVSFATEAATGAGLASKVKYADDIAGYIKAMFKEGALGGSAGIAGGVAKESTDNPWTVAVADILGGFGFSGASAAASKVTRKTLGATPKNLDDISDVIEDFEKIGATPTVTQATGGKTASGIEKFSKGLFFGDARFTKNAENTMTAIEKTIAKHVDKLGGDGITRQDVGGVVREGLKGFADRGAKRSEQLYNNVDKLVPKQTPVTMTNTRILLEEITGSIDGAGSISKALDDPEFTKLANAIIKDAGETNILPYEAMKTLRKRIWRKASHFNNESSGDFKRLYGAIVEDANAAAGNISPAAKQAVNKANSHYKRHNDILETHLDKIMKANDDAHITNLLENSGKRGATQLNALRRSLKPNEWGAYVAKQLDNLGKTTAGRQNDIGDVFSIDTFLTNWNKLPIETKNVLFAKNIQMKRDFETIAKVTHRIKDAAKKTVSKETNIKNLAGVGAAAFTSASFPIAAPIIATAILSANKLISVAMTSPKTLNWLAKGVNMRPEALNGHLTRLAIIAQNGNQDDREAAMEIMNILTQSEAQQ